MSKRQSRSAEFIGGFHNLDRNHTDIAEHVARWEGHVERWLAQLRSALKQRAELEKLLKSAGSKSSNDTVREAPSLRTRLALSNDRCRELARKIEDVIETIEDAGFAARSGPLDRDFAVLRGQVFPAEPPRTPLAPGQRSRQAPDRRPGPKRPTTRHKRGKRPRR